MGGPAVVRAFAWAAPRCHSRRGTPCRLPRRRAEVTLHELELGSRRLDLDTRVAAWPGRPIDVSACDGRRGRPDRAGVPPGIDGIRPARPAPPRASAGRRSSCTSGCGSEGLRHGAVHGRRSGPYPNPYESHERRLNNTGDAQNRVAYRESTNSKGGHQCSSRILADPISRFGLAEARIPFAAPWRFRRRRGRHRRSCRRSGAMTDASSHPHLTSTRHRAHRRVAPTT